MGFPHHSTFTPGNRYRRFHVELLRDNPFPKGVLGSKAIGEPPFMQLGSVDLTSGCIFDGM
jgi:xanthine dehydrogenase molybdopterin-binding subunit B